MRSFGGPAVLMGWVRPAAFRPRLTARLALSGTPPGGAVSVTLRTSRRLQGNGWRTRFGKVGLYTILRFRVST